MGPIEKCTMDDPTTHNLTREILALAQDRDVVDAYFDCLLACDVLRERMDIALGGGDESDESDD